MDADRTPRPAPRRALRRKPSLRVATVIVCVVAGFMMATSALASRGNDLRPDRTTELASLVQAEADRVPVTARKRGCHWIHLTSLSAEI